MIVDGPDIWKFIKDSELKLISVKMDFFKEVSEVLTIRNNKNGNNVIRQGGKRTLRIRYLIIPRYRM